MSHSTSTKKHAISKFDPQGTSKPRLSRVGGAVVLSTEDKIGGPCKCAVSGTTSFGRARYEKQHGGGAMGDD